MPITVDKDELSEAFQKALEDFPEQRTRFFDSLGETVLQRVQQGIGTYKTGKVQTWQSAHVGSKGYYAAVRPLAKTMHNHYAVGYITNAINAGHRVRLPSGKSKRYKATLTQSKMKVPGKHFYDSRADYLDPLVAQEAEKLADEIVASLEGGT